jgi:5-methylcytosine-specific restriction enzyme A
MAMKKHERHSVPVIRTKRWKALRTEALRRDGYKCVQCGRAGRLEVDHVLPVRTHPELSWDLTNLQTLCPSCHTRKTRLECGHKPLSPQRLRWRRLVSDLETPQSSKQEEATCLNQ